MERKELTRKDLEAIAAGTYISTEVIGALVIVKAADLEAKGYTVEQLASQLEIEASRIIVTR